jgi:hypothetical protein
MGGGKWIEKKSVGSPSFEGLKRDLERLIKKYRERGFAGATVFVILFVLVKGDCFSQSGGHALRK